MNNITDHFTWAEMTRTDTGLPNEPPRSSHAASCIRAMARLLEYVRGVLGKPIIINSCYRSPEVNRAVGGSRTSFHLIGCAADIRVFQYDDRDKETLERALRFYCPVEFIKYDTFWHVAFDISRLGNNGPVKTWQMEYPELMPDTPSMDDL